MTPAFSLFSTSEALLEDEQVKDRKMVVDVDLPLHDGVKVKQLATAIKLSECPCSINSPDIPLATIQRK